MRPNTNLSHRKGNIKLSVIPLVQKMQKIQIFRTQGRNTLLNMHNRSVFNLLSQGKEFQYYANLVFCIHKSVCSRDKHLLFCPDTPKEKSIDFKLHPFYEERI